MRWTRPALLDAQALKMIDFCGTTYINTKYWPWLLSLYISKIIKIKNQNVKITRNYLGKWTFRLLIDFSKCTNLRTTPIEQYFLGIDLCTTPIEQYFLGFGLFQNWPNRVELALQKNKSAYHPVWPVFSGDREKSLFLLLFFTFKLKRGKCGVKTPYFSWVFWQFVN